MCKVHRMRKAREGRSAIMHAVEKLVYERVAGSNRADQRQSMKAYGKKAKVRAITKDLHDQMSEYVQMLDLNNLLELHEKRGFGAKRLYEHMYGIAKRHIDNEYRYMGKDDKETLGVRGDVLVMKQRLAEIGFDYDKSCEEILQKILEYEKTTYGGRK